MTVTTRDIYATPAQLGQVLFSWSSGKNCAYAFHLLKTQGAQMVGLLTTYITETNRLRTRRTPLSFVQAQAGALGLPLYAVGIAESASPPEYESNLNQLFAEAQTNHGDFLLAYAAIKGGSLAEYRRDIVKMTGFPAVFPLWGVDTSKLAEQIIDAGIEAVVTSVDTELLPAEYLGRRYDHEFLAGLPAGIDRCAERREFLTVVVNSPEFKTPIRYTPGEVTQEGKYRHLDLILG